MAMFVTHISASMGAMTWMFLEWKRFGKPSALGIVTGMVAGLGTITPASGFVGLGGALIIGLLAGFTCFFATLYIKRVLKIDDSLDVFPVHGVGRILGTMMAGVFSSTQLGLFSGFGYAEDISSMLGQLQVQLIGVGAAILFTAATTYILLRIVDALFGLRIERAGEYQGLDLALHEERGYDL